VSASLEIGWFGKLPCAGDFIYRRLPRTLLSGLDNWLQQGLSQLRGTYPAEWRGIYETAPTWNCAIPAAVTQVDLTLIGLIMPSRDRVGREFPLCAGVAVPGGGSRALLASAHDWLQQLGRLVVQAKARPSTVEAFDAAVCGIALPPPAAQAPGDGIGDILSMLNVDDASGVSRRLFTARVLRVKGTYTFTSRLFARAIAQYVPVDRDPSLYYRPVTTHSGAFGGSALLAYKLNWQSVMFVGYGDDRELAAIAADQARRLAPLDRQVFVKVSYAFQR